MTPDETKLSAYAVDASTTLEDAMVAIQNNRHRTVIVIEFGKVVGVLSDGDVRKAILDRRILSTPVRGVMNVSFKSVTPTTLDRAKPLFTAGHAVLIPVVDDEMRLVDVLTAY